METDHAAACRFFTPGDACRLALDAYRDATDAMVPPFRQPWFIDGVPFAIPADFVDFFADALAARLGLLALDRLGEFRPPMERGNVYTLAHLAAPEKMRRIIADREAELRQDMADFGLLDLHDLPDGDNRPHNAATEGDAVNEIG